MKNFSARLKFVVWTVLTMGLALGAGAGSYSYTYSVSGVKGMDGNLYSGPAKIWGTREADDWEHCDMTLADGASSGSGSVGVSGEHDNYYFFTMVDADGNTFNLDSAVG